MLVGGPDDFGQVIIDRFSADWFSRRNGHDIDSRNVREKLCQTSLNYDVVILHAYSLYDGQNLLLTNLIRYWIDNDHTARLIFTGSIATHNVDFSKENPKNWYYTAQKSFADKLCQLTSKKCTEGKYKFKISVLKPGALDNKKSREKYENFTTGLSSDVFCDAINFIINLPDDVHLPEMVLDVTYCSEI